VSGTMRTKGKEGRGRYEAFMLNIKKTENREQNSLLVAFKQAQQHLQLRAWDGGMMHYARRAGERSRVCMCVCVCVHLYDGTEVTSIKEPQNVQQELVWEEPQHRFAFHDLHLPVRG
jgi:hypothetical protein